MTMYDLSLIILTVILLTATFTVVTIAVRKAGRGDKQAEKVVDKSKQANP
jgi:hypothetical protein